MRGAQPCRSNRREGATEGVCIQDTHLCGTDRRGSVGEQCVEAGCAPS